jgi:glycosyltransferase involved in cell wall biosynthesis
MRIVHTMLAPRKGGIESAFLRWTEALQALGHEVICLVARDAEMIAELPSSVEVHTLRQWFERDPVAIWQTRHWLKQRTPDVIISHGNRAGRVLRAAHRGAIPHVAVLHRPRFKGLSIYDAVACVSHDLMRQAMVQGVPVSRLHHIPNFLPGSLPLWLPRPFPANEVPVIGMLGRLVPEKGADMLIEAMASLPHMRAIIGGDGPERPAIEAAIKRQGLQDRVRLEGWVDDVAAFYRSIDVLCVPSRSESFGLILLEAWAYGVPVIATRTSGPSEILTHGHDGLLCDISVEALASAIRVMLDNSTQASSMAAHGQKTLEKYRMEAVLPHIQALVGRYSTKESPPAPLEINQPASR